MIHDIIHIVKNSLSNPIEISINGNKETAALESSKIIIIVGIVNNQASKQTRNVTNVNICDCSDEKTEN